jgi:hypothetical protein
MQSLPRSRSDPAHATSQSAFSLQNQYCQPAEVEGKKGVRDVERLALSELYALSMVWRQVPVKSAAEEKVKQ